LFSVRTGLILLLFAGSVHAAETGSILTVAAGYEEVEKQCTACHSARLITQNRSDREGWQQMIRWMQDTQGLWPLGDAEPVILDYLAKNYGPLETGRRKPLNVEFE